MFILNSNQLVRISRLLKLYTELIMFHNDRNKQYFTGKEYSSNSKNMEPPADYFQQIKEETASVDSEGKQKSFTRLCERFAEKTSMQGIPYINVAKLWYAKVLWVLIFIGGLVGMSLHLYFLIDQFTDFEVQVSTTLGFSNLEFPSVTICNVNAIRKSQLYQTSEQLQSLVEQTNPQKINVGPPPVGRRRKKRYVEEFNIDFDNLTKDYDKSPRGGEKDQTAKITSTFRNLYMMENRKTRRDIGHLLKDMLLQCSFAGYECYPSNFSLIQTEEYGNCYRIQSRDFVASSPGPSNGLTLTFYMETEEYLTGINQGFGARVLIHDYDTYPFPYKEGFFVPAAFETHIGLKQLQIIRKGGLYGDCENVDSFYEQYGATYTRTLCQFLCRQNAYIARCNCYDNNANDVINDLNTTFTARPCKTSSERECLADIKAEFEITAPACDQCFNPCQEVQYIKSLSSRNWPTDEYANVLMQSMCENIAHKCDSIRILPTDDLLKNFVKLVIYYEDLNFEKIEEVPEIETQQFASDVGGAVGLWIGLSMISVFEVIQLLLECCAFAAHKCRKPPNKSRELKYKMKSGNDQHKNGMGPRQFPRPQIRNGNFDPHADWNSRV